MRLSIQRSGPDEKISQRLALTSPQFGSCVGTVAVPSAQSWGVHESCSTTFFCLVAEGTAIIRPIMLGLSPAGLSLEWTHRPAELVAAAIPAERATPANLDRASEGRPRTSTASSGRGGSDQGCGSVATTFVRAATSPSARTEGIESTSRLTD
jgi:hypothetical protein